MIKRPEHEVWIAIAITPRCGSTALCSIISKTQKLGKPEEILNPRGPAQWLLGKASPKTFQEYLDTVSEKVRTNSIFSFKTCWGDFKPVLDSGICEGFIEKLAWVYLERNNLDKQTISLARARKTGRWHRKINDPESPDSIDISSRELSAARTELIREKAGWQNFFQQRRIRPLILTYENLMLDLSPASSGLSRLANLGENFQLSWHDSDYLRLSPE